VAQQNEHLTTEQLSAFLDKQLSPAERAVFDAHLASCQQCPKQAGRFTADSCPGACIATGGGPPLFRSTQQVSTCCRTPYPRPATITPVPQRRGARVSVLQRTVRAVSTLAAVLALIFILSGILPPIHFGGGEATSSAGSVPAATNQRAASNSAPTPATTFGSAQAADGTKTPVQTPKSTPAATARSSIHSGTSPAVQPPTLPPFLDLSRPEGRLALGALLLVLGIIGLVVTRRRRGAVY